MNVVSIDISAIGPQLRLETCGPHRREVALHRNSVPIGHLHQEVYLGVIIGVAEAGLAPVVFEVHEAMLS